MLLQHGQEFLKLNPGVSRAVVQVDDFLGFRQGQAQAFGSQGQLETRWVACGVTARSPPGPCAGRRQQSHILVKADGPGGEIKFFGQIPDAVGDRHGVALVIGRGCNRSIVSDEWYWIRIEISKQKRPAL